MSSINRDYHLNKRGKMVKSHGDTAVRVLLIVLILIVMWGAFIIFFSKYAEVRLGAYANAENQYEIETTLLNITASLWGAFISGIATGSVAFLVFWRSARTSKRDELLDRCWQIRPDISVEVEYRSPDVRPDKEEYYMTDFRNRKRYVRLVSEISPQTLKAILAEVTYEELLAYRDEAMKASNESGKSEYDSLTREEKAAIKQLFADLETMVKSQQKGNKKRKVEKKSGMKSLAIETSRQSVLPVLNCKETAAEVDYDPKRDAWLTIYILNSGYGTAVLDNLICRVSGQVWNIQYELPAAMDGYKYKNACYINVIVEKQYYRQIQFGIEFTDSIGIKYSQGFEVYLDPLLDLKNDKNFHNQLIADITYQPIMME